MQKINFENLPSTNTPINATNLNTIQDNAETAINAVDVRVTSVLSQLVNLIQLGTIDISAGSLTIGGKIGIEWGTGSITSDSSATSGLYGGHTNINFVHTYDKAPITVPCWGGSYVNQVDIYSLTGTRTSATIGGHLTSASSTRTFRYFTFGILPDSE